MVTLRPRSTSSRPNEAAAMPFPKEDTTPPVTKMYLVALGPVVIRPVLERCASGLRPVGDPRLYRLRAAPAPAAARPQSSSRCARRAAAPVARPAPPRRAGALPSAPVPPG